jgi:DNA-binding MarR family transcriptional regulator
MKGATVTIQRAEMNQLLYGFLETIYVFQQSEVELFDVSWQEIYLLKHMKEAGEKTVGEVATLLKVPLFQASRIVQRLANQGLVTKQRSAENHRVVLVSITAQGLDRVEAMEEYHYTLLQKNLHVLEPTELISIISGLGKIKQLLAVG